MGKPKQSPALKLMLMTYKQRCAAAPFSWDRINKSLDAALCLAISGGFRFNPDDFAEIADRCKGGYWMTADGHMLGERFYASAISNESMSAIVAFETWKDRGPFIADKVRPAFGNWSHLGNRPRSRKRDRVAVGSIFPWRGEQVTVTSFAESGEFFTACSYKPDADRPGWMTKKILHRYKITRADIIADRAARKQNTTAKGFANDESHEQT